MHRESRRLAGGVHCSAAHCLLHGWTLKQIYKITWLTGKIYIGKDRLGSARYLGSIARDVLNRDFKNLTDAVRNDYPIRKEILWQSEDCTEAELSAKEVEFIRKYNSNLPHMAIIVSPSQRKSRRIALDHSPATFERSGALLQ